MNLLTCQRVNVIVDAIWCLIALGGYFLALSTVWSTLLLFHLAINYLPYSIKFQRLRPLAGLEANCLLCPAKQRP
jgi:hypothetical protein